MSFSISDLEDGLIVTLQDLLVQITDPSISDVDKESIAAHVRKLYPVKDNVAEYVYVACDALEVSDEVVSWALRILYVYGRKFPEATEPMEAFRTVMKRGLRRSQFVKTQAFIHLLLMDVDAAEEAARSHMSTMVTLAMTERRHPTLREGDADEYQEALLKLLFH